MLQNPLVNFASTPFKIGLFCTQPKSITLRANIKIRLANARTPIRRLVKLPRDDPGWQSLASHRWQGGYWIGQWKWGWDDRGGAKICATKF